MSADFRLASDFLRHHKVQRLRARLGADGVLAWLGLIGYTAANKPDGRLTGLIPEDIVAVAEWKGEQDFVATLVDLHLLDRRARLYTLHNWSTRQPWITSSEKRWQKARKAAAARWAKPKKSTQSTVISDSAGDATSIATSNATSTAQSNAPNLTEPNLSSPIPSPNPETKKESPADSPPAQLSLSGNGHKPERLTPEELVEGWNEIAAELQLPKVLKLSKDRRRKALAVLSEHPDPEFWEGVLRKIRTSRFFRGLQNGDGKHRDWKGNFDLLIRDGTVPLKIAEGVY